MCSKCPCRYVWTQHKLGLLARTWNWTKWRLSEIIPSHFELRISILYYFLIRTFWPLKIFYEEVLLFQKDCHFYQSSRIHYSYTSVVASFKLENSEMELLNVTLLLLLLFCSAWSFLSFLKFIKLILRNIYC